MPKAAKTRGLSAYGIQWPYDDPIRIELECIKMGGVGYWVRNGKPDGHGLAHHVIAFSKLVWPWFTWHRWAANLMLPALCRPKSDTVIFGPSNSSKSSLVAITYLSFYFASPNDTLVLLSSDTRENLDLRIWGEMKMLFAQAKELCPWLPGHMTNSKQMISTQGKDEEFGRDIRCGVVGRPCKVGNRWLIGSGTSPYAGIKSRRALFLAADEAHFMPPGFLEALANLTANPECSCAIMGNMGSLDTPLGDAAEPELGWDSIPDTEKSRVYKTRRHNGVAVQLIASDSPQLDHPEGHEPYGPLIGRDYITRIAHNYGEGTPLFNMFAGGRIPRGTMENRIITRKDCERNHAFEDVIWGHDALVRLYCMDVSYTASHGDRTVGRPLVFGKDVTGQWRLAPLSPPLVYTPNDRADLSITRQIALQCAAECKKWMIPPSHVFYDGTGRSDFTKDLMDVMGFAVNPVEFGGSPSPRPNFIEKRYEDDFGPQKKKGDLLPCDEVFDRMVSELWFSLRHLVVSGQARQLDMETVKEAEKRLYESVKGRKMSIEKKDEIKIRLGRSPDLADCLVVGIEGARRLGFPLGKLATATKSNSQWLQRRSREWMDARAAVELAA